LTASPFEGRYHTGGEASDFGIQFPISGTDDPELYQVRVNCLYPKLRPAFLLV
jgi:hypothetical protein